MSVVIVGAYGLSLVPENNEKPQTDALQAVCLYQFVLKEIRNAFHPFQEKQEIRQTAFHLVTRCKHRNHTSIHLTIHLHLFRPSKTRKVVFWGKRAKSDRHLPLNCMSSLSVSLTLKQNGINLFSIQLNSNFQSVTFLTFRHETFTDWSLTNILRVIMKILQSSIGKT